MAQEVIAVIGAGGKTTALEILAQQSRAKKVLVTTTTHIYPTAESLIDPSSEALTQALNRNRIVWTGSTCKQGKLGLLPQPVLKAGIEAAELVIYEGDGANRRPLKLHNSYEPVILPQTTVCLVVAGLSGLGKPAADVVHRYDLAWEEDREVGVLELLHCAVETANASGVPKSHLRIFLNQADVLQNVSLAEKAVKILQEKGYAARYGSLQKGVEDLYQWVTAM